MPWRQEKEEEEKKFAKKLEKEKKELKQQSINDFVKTMKVKEKAHEILKEEMKYQKNGGDSHGEGNDLEDIKKISKVIKVKHVETVKLSDYTGQV